MRALLRSYGALTVLLAGSACLVYPVLAHGWSWAPLVLGAICGLVMAGRSWVNLLPWRVPLGEDQADLGHWAKVMAELAGVRVERLSVVDLGRDVYEPDEVLIRDGELVYRQADLDEFGLHELLTVTGQQLAAALQPPLCTPLGGALTGAGLGLVLGLRVALGNTAAADGVAMVGALLLFVAVTVALVRREMARATRIQERMSLLLGEMRTHHPEPFEALARKQGLLPEEGTDPSSLSPEAEA